MQRENLSTKKSKKALIASLIGTSIEWYDFFLYGTMAAIVFNKLFFPNDDPVIALLLAYASFAVSFLIRPLGGIFFSHLGDKIGRKKSLIYTLFLMGLATIIIGLLPTYEMVGIWAPILLLICRLGQGLGIGGEWGGAMLLAVEYAPEKKRGFFGSVPQMGSPIGMLLGTLTVSILTVLLSDDAFMSWGWRIPFIASAVLVIVGLWIRNGLEETPAFQEAQKSKKVVKVPLTHTLKYHWKAVLIAIGAKVVETGPYFIFTVFITSFATGYLGVSDTVALNAVTVGALCSAIMIPLIGALSDKVGRKGLFLTATVATILFAFPYYYLLSFGTTAWIMIATILAMVLWTPTTAVLGTMFSEIFSTNVRYTGLSLGYMIGGALAGGTAPMMATALMGAFNDSWVPVAILIMVMGVISLIAVLSTKESKNVDISEESSKTIVG